MMTEATAKTTAEAEMETRISDKIGRGEPLTQEEHEALGPGTPLIPPEHEKELCSKAQACIKEALRVLGRIKDEGEQRDTALMLYGSQNPCPAEYNLEATLWYFGASVIFAMEWQQRN